MYYGYMYELEYWGCCDVLIKRLTRKIDDAQINGGIIEMIKMEIERIDIRYSNYKYTDISKLKMFENLVDNDKNTFLKRLQVANKVMLDRNVPSLSTTVNLSFITILVTFLIAMISIISIMNEKNVADLLVLLRVVIVLVFCFVGVDIYQLIRNYGNGKYKKALMIDRAIEELLGNSSK